MATKTETVGDKQSHLPQDMSLRNRFWLFCAWFRRLLKFDVSLTQRILILNLAALIALLVGILYLNQFREGLIDAKVESLRVQGEIIAGAIASSATVETDTIRIDPDKLLKLQAGDNPISLESRLRELDFPINPEQVAPILRRLISPTKTRARIYDRDGMLILDSSYLYSRGQILHFDQPDARKNNMNSFERLWRSVLLWFRRSEWPLYEELGNGSGRGYPEVVSALSGKTGSIVRVNQRGELIVSVAVPVKRLRLVSGVLLLSTQGGDIDKIVQAEHLGIFRVFLVASAVTALLSVLLAGTIAGPMHRLSDAADQVRQSKQARTELPDFGHRSDEIGHLARALRDMTNALYNRIDAIEAFAADVAHELKNPLTSLRSAVETLPLAKNSTAHNRLLEIIQHDVQRLDRLISDISDASRLDAELAREDAQEIDLAEVIKAVVEIQHELSDENAPLFFLNLDKKAAKVGDYLVRGYDSRLGQVFINLLDNARSFSPPGSRVTITVQRVKDMIIITIDDEGPGIRAEDPNRVFERFYTDRPDTEAFGNNSGLGLSISKQIIEAHGGAIYVENRIEDTQDNSIIRGARFILHFPAL